MIILPLFSQLFDAIFDLGNFFKVIEGINTMILENKMATQEIKE